MWQEQYRRMFEPLTVRESLIEETLAQAQRQKRKQSLFWGRRWILLAAVGLCLFFAAPVVAANVPMVYTMLYGVSPEAAQFFVPVERACEDKGIRLEAIATYVHSAEAEVYFTLQDLTGDRLDETVSIDVFGLQSRGGKIGDAVGSCPLVHYDAESRTATFLLNLRQFEGKAITGRMLDLSLAEFFIGRQSYEDMPMEYDLTQTAAPAWQEVSLTGGSITHPENPAIDYEEISLAPYPVLAPQHLADTPLETIWLSGLSYADGALHVQLASTDVAQTDSHGDFYLVNAAGDKILYDYSLCFSDNRGEAEEICYQEFVFQLEKSQLVSCTLYGNFYAYAHKINGHWQVRFPLVNAG